MKSGDTFIVQVTKAAASPTPVSSAGAAPIPQAVAPIPQADSGPSVITVAMATLVSSNNSETARIALETLLKVIDNILKNPEESKVRWLLKLFVVISVQFRLNIEPISASLYLSLVPIY